MNATTCDYPGCTADGVTELGHVGTTAKRRVCDDHYGLVPYPTPEISLTPAEQIWVRKVAKHALDTGVWSEKDNAARLVRELLDKVSNPGPRPILGQ